MLTPLWDKLSDCSFVARLIGRNLCTVLFWLSPHSTTCAPCRWVACRCSSCFCSWLTFLGFYVLTIQFIGTQRFGDHYTWLNIVCFLRGILGFSAPKTKCIDYLVCLNFYLCCRFDQFLDWHCASGPDSLTSTFQFLATSLQVLVTFFLRAFWILRSCPARAYLLPNRLLLFLVLRYFLISLVF